MKRVHPVLACVLVVAAVVGCGQANSVGSAGSGSGGGQAAAGTGATDAAGGEMAASGAGAAGTPSDSQQPAGDAEEKAGALSGLLEGITDQRYVRQFNMSSNMAAENPNDWQAQLQYVNILQAIGGEQQRNNDKEKAFQAFLEAAKAARKFLETKVEFPAEANRLLAYVFYNEACVKSQQNDSDGAIAALEDSMKWGFGEFEMMEQDEDLTLLRSLPDFAERVEKWKAQARELTLKRARDELAQGESFSFDFSLTDVDGKPIKLADYKGKVVIVDVWGTWCPPCRAEIPSFVKLQETYGEKGFQMIGLNEENGSAEEAVAKVKSFMEQQKMNYPCALIDETTKNQIPNLEGYPTTLFLDRSGKVRMKVVGLHEYAYLEAIVLALLDEPAPEAAAE